ncbi:MAG: glycosyltransferase family 4 protein [Bacteroidales bacterium]|nr:glycosyltransferase family 4 protein [Bacteroidales bacterium]MBN2820700.1 glycosyltransferase family 4 protein [Bacteroidales bacterium]
MPKQKLIFYGIKYFPSKGGTSRVAENLIRNLNILYDISIYCYKHPKAKGNVDGVNAIEFPALPFGSAGVFIYFFITAIHLLFTQKKTAIIHAHKTDCAFFVPLLKIKFKNIIATSHEAPYKRDKWSALGRIYFHLMEWFFIHSGAKLTSISKPLSEYYEEKYNRKVTFIANGIDVRDIYDLKAAEEILAGNQIEEPFIMFSARRIMSTKGLHTMLEALHLLKSTKPIVVCGDIEHAKPYVNSLKQKYKNLKLFFIGFVELPTLMGLLKKAELFIFPSETEGMSIMLLEVTAVGTPIISSDIPENTQVFTNEEMLFFKSKDSVDLKDKIEFSYANKEKMSEYSKKAVLKIKTSYKWTIISEDYIHIYNKPNKR